jgi:hypothetical protein
MKTKVGVSILYVAVKAAAEVSVWRTVGEGRYHSWRAYQDLDTGSMVEACVRRAVSQTVFFTP